MKIKIEFDSEECNSRQLDILTNLFKELSNRDSSAELFERSNEQLRVLPVPEDVYFDTEEEAQYVLDNMVKTIKKFGQCNLTSFYVFSGFIGGYKDPKYDRFGWIDLSEAKIERIEEIPDDWWSDDIVSYYISLPKIELLPTFNKEKDDEQSETEGF